MNNSDIKVYVGMSGGVDSSVAAALLQQQGYDVTGVYMKNWSQDLPGMRCPWIDDYQDAKRVAVQLGIPFKMYDFENQYREKVVGYMLDGYQRGLTPNPDIMCNQEVKFRLFLDAALSDGADMIATGHYARIRSRRTEFGREVPGLFVAANVDKDQTYFLYRVSQQALEHSLMPIGDFTTKAEVREMAKKLGLATAEKKDSQGICFVGKVGIKDFLLHELGEQEPGDILDQNGVRIGRHDGAIFYTIGQRQGLGVGGGLPYYVTGKDMARNEVYVTTDIQDEKLWRDRLRLTQLHWINEPPESDQAYTIRTRYRAEPVPGVFNWEDSHGTDELSTISFIDPVRAITPGQSAVIYDGDHVVGGGVVV